MTSSESRMRSYSSASGSSITERMTSSAMSDAPPKRTRSSPRRCLLRVSSKCVSVWRSRLSRAWNVTTPSMKGSRMPPNWLLGRSAPLAMTDCMPRERVMRRRILLVSLYLNVWRMIASVVTRAISTALRRLQSRAQLGTPLLKDTRVRLCRDVIFNACELHEPAPLRGGAPVQTIPEQRGDDRARGHDHHGAGTALSL